MLIISVILLEIGSPCKYLVCFGGNLQRTTTPGGEINHICSIVGLKTKQDIKKGERINLTFRAGQVNPVRLQEHKEPLTALQRLAGEHEAGR